jgi:16S rRNA (cytosine1402-N4)-methyltransferase
MAPEAATGLAGVVYDLGISHHQAVSPARGFSYQAKGPLDMRFNQSSKPVAGGFETRPVLTAAELIQRSSEQDIQRILQDYGEEHFAGRIARQISRMRGCMNSTEDLFEAVRRATPPRFRSKSLMRVFQAFRFAVNDELENLRRGLDAAIRLLAADGRIVLVAYESLGDRIVKQTFREARAQGVLEVITRKPLRPQPEEVAANPSARSARLRAALRTPEVKVEEEVKKAI